MDVVFQLVSSPENLPRFLDQVARHFSSVADPTTTVSVRGTRHGALADNYRTFKFLDTHEILKELISHPPEMDVLAIANAMDIGLEECKEMFDIPVLGYMQVNLLMAQLYGRKLALLAPSRGFVRRFEEVVSAYGLDDVVVEVIPLQFDRIPDLDQLFDSDGHKYLTGMETLIESNVHDVDADAILPCGPPALYLAQQGVREIAGVRLIDGYAILCKVAEVVGRLNLSSNVPWMTSDEATRMPKELRSRAAAVFSSLP